MKFTQKFIISFSCILWTYSSYANQTFGNYGRNGRNGLNGKPGYSAESTSVHTQNIPQRIQISGSSGADGSPGEDGENAQNCGQFRGNSDLIGADGGNAGAGGNGGNGGNAGNITVFYQNPSQLVNLLIIARGGNPGRGALAGRPGRACECQVPEWTTIDCHPVQKNDGSMTENCQNNHHYCHSGRDGKSAEDGVDGQQGQHGIVTLVKADQLPEETPYASTDFTNIQNVKLMRLSENIFKQQNHAENLFAPGSILSSSYWEYVKHSEKLIYLTWDSNKNPAEFSQSKLTANYRNRTSEEIDLAIESQDIFVTDMINDSGRIHFKILDAYHPQELSQVSAKIEGKLRDLKVILTDLSPRQDLIDDQISLDLKRHRWMLGFHDVFGGSFPKDLIKKDGNTTILYVGKLNIDEASDTFEEGRKLRLNIHIDRKINNNRQIPLDFKLETSQN